MPASGLEDQEDDTLATAAGSMRISNRNGLGNPVLDLQRKDLHLACAFCRQMETYNWRLDHPLGLGFPHSISPRVWVWRMWNSSWIRLRSMGRLADNSHSFGGRVFLLSAGVKDDSQEVRGEDRGK